MSESYSRPIPKPPPEELGLWIDLATGLGVDFDGHLIKAELPGRRKKPRLVDLLDTARLRGVHRVILCGDSTPTGHDWLLPSQAQISKGEQLTPGWRDAGHYLGDPATGRFRHNETGHQVAISTTRDWFGDTILSPRQAQFGFETLRHVVGSAIEHPDWALMRTPSQTGLNIWKQRFDKARDFKMRPIDPDIGREIQATEPQHRNEIYTAGEGHCDCGDCVALITAEEIPAFFYADGRFMYHGVAKQASGAGPAIRLTAEQAAELFTRDPYFPARFKVRFEVPDYWDHLGFFPVKHDSAARGWHWPNRPGYVGETWANMMEIHTAIREGGWSIKFIEGVQLTKTNVVQPLAHVCGNMISHLDQMRARKDIGDVGHEVISAAIKHMFRVTIGSFSRRQRNTTRFASRFEEISNNAIGGSARQTANGGWMYEVASGSKPDDIDTYHPEVAAMVWGASRTRVLRFSQHRGQQLYGALQIEPQDLIGIQGDAVYTTTLVRSTLPVEMGGIDDGSSGRLRIKGYLPGPLPTPSTLMDRQELSNNSEEHDWRTAL